jgi:predicted AlkP superfamily phosphohydrolase/phosphomutase
MSERRVLVVGLDGVGWHDMRRICATGPAAGRRGHEAVTGPLASTVHPHSPTAWSSFLTGMNPGKHGIYDFLRRRTGQYDIEVVSTRTRGGRALWSILSEAGISCGVMNVPMTYPPEKVRGFFVSGTFTSDPAGALTWPRSIGDELTRVLGAPYRADAHLSDLTAAVNPGDHRVLDAFIERVLAVEDARLRAMVHLIDRHRPRCAVYVATGTDRVQHSAWDDPPRLAPIYRAAGRAIEELMRAMGEETTLIVMSDHGGAPLTRVMDITRWLEREGYWVGQRDPLTREALAGAAVRGALRLAKATWPRGLRAALKARVPSARGLALRYRRAVPPDWSRTRAFAEGTYGNVVLNLRGREPRGIVAPGAEYTALCEDIRERLLAVVDPVTRARPVERVCLREELYHGPRVHEAPDVIAVLARGYQMVGDVLGLTHDPGDAEWTGCFASAQPNRFGLTGTHGPVGGFVACGPGIVRRPGTAFPAHITDLAPTILTLFGVPVPEDMDGRVLAEILA